MYGDRNFPLRAALPTAAWLLLVCAALVCCARPALAFHRTPAGVVHAWILVDAGSGRVLEAFHPERRAHPASLTKLMTLYITFQHLQKGGLSLDTRMHVSRHAARQQPTKLWLRPGGSITVRDAILGITTRSANDAAVALGEFLGGSEARFARMMNQEARVLGMTRTTFYNASGLPNARQWTTARDMATLAVALIHTFPQYYHFFGVRCFRFHHNIVYGHDHLLDECDGVDGLKTGYVSASGYNIVTSAIRNDRRLVGVVLGGVSAGARDAQMVALMNRGFGSPSVPTLLATHATPSEPAHRADAVAELVKTAAADSSVSSSRDWIIEVGGNFPSQTAVRLVLRSARRSAPTSLLRGHPLVVRLRGRHYRARFDHLSREEAQRTCSVLERKKFTCRLLDHALPVTQDLASAAAINGAQSD